MSQRRVTSLRQTDAALRGIAIPFEANPFGANRRHDHASSVANDSGGSDLQPLTLARGDVPAQTNVIRCHRPMYGHVTAASLTLRCQSATTDPANPLRVFLGRFDEADLPNAVTSYTADEIADGHRLLKGDDEAWEYGPGVDTHIQRLNLMPAMLGEGDTGYYPDGFVVVLYFENGAPNGDFANGYRFTQFFVDCAFTMNL